ncbi:MAG: hypothetical protein KDI17_07115 [Halioglobus sp.]|nr:hypothetical protein [Halioglobus sp.]
MNVDTESESLDQYGANSGVEESPATRRNRLCAMAQLKASRWRSTLPTYVASRDELERITDAFRATLATEEALEPYIMPIYIFRLVFESEMIRAKTSNNFRVQHQAEQLFENTKVLISCFITGTWPMGTFIFAGDSVQNSLGKGLSPARRTTPVSLQHDADIERALRELGVDPLNLPTHQESGRPGLKSQVKAKLSNFTDASFDHAWKRARRRSKEAQMGGEI